jgi:RimJ/RimL family protein N-acetyltransferase
VRHQVSGVRYQVSGIRYQVSGIRYQVSGVRYQVSGVGARNEFQSEAYQKNKFINMNFPFGKEIILENSIALLRPLQISDIRYLLKIATEEKELLRYSPIPIYSEKLLTEYIQKSLNERQHKTRYSFSIFDKKKNAYAGSTSFMNISNIDSRVEIGSTWIGKDFRRTGLNRNCKYLLLNFAFEELKTERVELKTDERNTASRNAIQKIGGKFEGTLRSHTLMYDGFRRNTVYYSILKSEWADLKEGFLKE